MADEDPNVDTSTPSTTETPIADNGPEPTSSRDDPAQSVEDKKRSPLNASIRSEFDKHKREPSPARQAAAAQRARDQGKFAPEGDRPPTEPQAKVETPGKTGAAPEAQTQSPAAKPGEQPAGSAPAVAPPSSWSKEARDHWASIPPAIQQAVAKREDEVSKGFAQYQTRTRDIDQAFTPQRRAVLQQYGKSEGQAIDQLFGWHEALSDPLRAPAAFRALATSHQFDLSTLVQSPGQQQTQQDPNDPRALISQHVAPMLNPLAQQLQTLQTAYEREQQARAHEQATKVHSEITEFSKDKPHFEKVREVMGQLLNAGVATSLDDAYQKATWADPDIRSEIMGAEQAKREAEARTASQAAQAKAAADAEAQRKADAEAAAKARRANVSVRGSTPVAGGSRPPKAGKPLRESLVEAIQGNRASV